MRLACDGFPLEKVGKTPQFQGIPEGTPCVESENLKQIIDIGGAMKGA